MIILSVILLAISLKISVLEPQVEKFLVTNYSKKSERKQKTYLASPLSSPGSGVGGGVAWSVTSVFNPVVRTAERVHGAEGDVSRCGVHESG